MGLKAPGNHSDQFLAYFPSFSEMGCSHDHVAVPGHGQVVLWTNKVAPDPDLGGQPHHLCPNTTCLCVAARPWERPVIITGVGGGKNGKNKLGIFLRFLRGFLWEIWLNNRFKSSGELFGSILLQ